MIEKLIFKIPKEVGGPVDPTDFADILGSNYLLDFNPNIASSMSVAGSGQVNSITSVGIDTTSTFAASGSNRPLLVSGALNGKDVIQFDGVASFMQIASSNSLVDYLHKGQGTIIAILKPRAANPNNLQALVTNTNGSTANIGLFLTYEDRASQGTNDEYRCYITKGSAGQFVSQIREANALTSLQYHSIVTQFDNANGVAADRQIVHIDNGSAIQTNTFTSPPSNSSASGNLTLGRATSTSFYYANMELARLIIVDTLLTPTQLSQIHARILFEYGTLPI